MVDEGEASHDEPDHLQNHACKKWDYGQPHCNVLHFWIVGSGSCQATPVPCLMSTGMKMGGAK